MRSRELIFYRVEFFILGTITIGGIGYIIFSLTFGSV